MVVARSALICEVNEIKNDSFVRYREDLEGKAMEVLERSGEEDFTDNI